MIMVLIIAIRSQSILLVVGRVARYALVGVYSLDFGADSLLFYGRARRIRANSHARRCFTYSVPSPPTVICLFQSAGYEGVEMVGFPHGLGGVVGEEAWK